MVVDFSGRPGLHMDCKFTAGSIRQLDTQLVFEFFQGFVNHALVTLHRQPQGLQRAPPVRDDLQGLRSHLRAALSSTRARPA